MTLEFGDAKMLRKFEGYHPSNTIFYGNYYSEKRKRYTFAAIIAYCCSQRMPIPSLVMTTRCSTPYRLRLRSS